MRALVLALLAAGVAGCLAAEQGPSPPCPTGWAPDPEATGCVKGNSTCRAWYRAPIKTPLNCVAISADGRGFLRASLGGAGSAVAKVSDGKGNVVFDRTFPIPSAGDFPLKGAKGDWQLSVEFDARSGTGSVRIWG